MSLISPVPMKDPGDYIDFAEAELLLKDTVDPRDKIILALLWRCGMRAFELGHLKWKHFDPQEGIIIVEGKGNKAMRVPMEPEVVGWISQYKNIDATPEDYILEGHYKHGISRKTVWRIVKAASLRSGILVTKSNRKLHPHSLRHSLAIWMVKMGVPLPKIQQILRHSSLVPTTYYLQFSMKELASDYLLAWERAKIGIKSEEIKNTDEKVPSEELK